MHAILLTHAHLDRSGYLPLMVREGFHGKVVWATPGTGALCEILLPDNGHLQEEDASALPLYTREDAQADLKRIHTVDFNRTAVARLAAHHALCARSGLHRARRRPQTHCANVSSGAWAGGP